MNIVHCSLNNMGAGGGVPRLRVHRQQGGDWTSEVRDEAERAVARSVTAQAQEEVEEYVQGGGGAGQRDYQREPGQSQDFLARMARNIHPEGDVNVAGGGGEGNDVEGELRHQIQEVYKYFGNIRHP